MFRACSDRATCAAAPAQKRACSDHELQVEENPQELGPWGLGFKVWGFTNVS